MPDRKLILDHRGRIPRMVVEGDEETAILTDQFSEISVRVGRRPYTQDDLRRAVVRLHRKRKEQAT